MDLAALYGASTKLKTVDSCTVYNFENKDLADQFSDRLQEIGIVGAAGGKKFVAKHIKDNPAFGVVLTVEQNLTLRIKIEGHAPMQKRASLLSNALNDEYQRIKKADPHFNKLTPFRNSEPSFNNMMTALRMFGESGDLMKTFSAVSANGHGAAKQPDTIRETFKQALDPDVHGGFAQTIESIRDDQAHPELVAIAIEIMTFLDTLAL